ncbi:unnamed protein product [Moneuplotes crassus]|uniref:Uncharacterized protein n=1 Tax=Euplotes crassus TaxID=5936 RepID=A0AAD1XIH7_EUPCR|nr:unnamed protein product [Moneuplotes crassus]
MIILINLLLKMVLFKKPTSKLSDKIEKLGQKVLPIQPSNFIKFDDSSSERTSENEPVANLPSEHPRSVFNCSKGIKSKDSQKTVHSMEEGVERVNILIDKKISNEIRSVKGRLVQPSFAKTETKRKMINDKRKMYYTSKSNVFSMVNKEVNLKDLRDSKPIVPKPSTTLKLNKKIGKRKVKIQLKKNSLSIPKFDPADISSGLSDITKSYIPDFGYANQLEFDRQHGWELVLDFISKYPRRAKTANTINDLIKKKEIISQKRKDVVKNKNFTRFINQPEDRKSNYPIIERMIKIREDFENFYDEFVEFSRDFYIMKGTIKAHQQKVKRRVRKLLEWNDMRGSKIKINTGESSNILSKFSSNIQNDESSSDSSVNTKRKKMIQLEHQMSMKFDEYYFKHKRVPVGLNKKKKHISDNNFGAKKPALNAESEGWNGDHSEKDSKIVSSCDNELLRKSPIKKLNDPASLKEKRIMSHDFTTRQAEKLYKRDCKKDTLEPFLNAQSIYMKNLVQNFQRMIGVLKSQNVNRDLKSLDRIKEETQDYQYASSSKISELLNSLSVSKLECSVKDFMSQIVEKLNEMFGKNESEIKYFKNNLQRLMSSYKSVNSPKPVHKRVRSHIRKVEISRNFGDASKTIKMKPRLMSPRIKNFVKLNLGQSKRFKIKGRTRFKRIYLNDYMNPSSMRKRMNTRYKKDARSNVFTPPSTRPQTMTPFTVGSKEDLVLKKIASDTISESGDISTKVSVIKRSQLKNSVLSTSRNQAFHKVGKSFSPEMALRTCSARFKYK